jgi:hypothetical protein
MCGSRDALSKKPEGAVTSQSTSQKEAPKPQVIEKVVDVTGFEPATPCLQSREPLPGHLSTPFDNLLQNLTFMVASTLLVSHRFGWKHPHFHAFCDTGVTLDYADLDTKARAQIEFHQARARSTRSAARRGSPGGSRYPHAWLGLRGVCVRRPKFFSSTPRSRGSRADDARSIS